MPKSVVVQVRTSPEQRTAWQAAADLCDLSLSDWIRKQCLKSFRVSYPSEEQLGAPAPRKVVTPEPTDDDAPLPNFVRRSHHPRCPCALCQK